MPDDERESDDLFEDLDKFFAPIKDVEWDEPEEPASPADPPGEEHVVVRSGSEPVVTEPPAAGQTPARGLHVRGRRRRRGGPGDWYDTASPRSRRPGARGRRRTRRTSRSPVAPRRWRVPTTIRCDLFARPAVEDEWPADEDPRTRSGTGLSEAELEEAAAHFSGSGRSGSGGIGSSRRPDR